jgi:predicted small lipoprotein YifL
MRNAFLVPAVALVALTLVGCATERPVLYPNEKLNQAGPTVSQQDMDQCMALAESSGAHASAARLIREK